MALKKLEILEDSLSRFRQSYDEIRVERDALKKEIVELKEINRNLIREKDSVREKVDSLISRIEELGL